MTHEDRREYVYLAGPMSGIEDHNFPAFRDARGHLRALGYRVHCPAEHDERDGFDPATGDGLLSPAEYMAIDLPYVCRASSVVVLPGWRESRGASIEVHVAQALGIPVLEYPTLRGIS